MDVNVRFGAPGRNFSRHPPRPWKLYEKSSVSNERLNFAIPANRLLRRFDEVRVVFRLDRARADAAAKIAIDHLVLVPRGQ